jgi:serine/threonine protein kinase/type II secretory pathway pseudopilin PulG
MQGVPAAPQEAGSGDFNVGKTIQAGGVPPPAVQGLGETLSPAQQQYLEACRMAGRDGVITPQARSMLDVLQKALSIDHAVAQAIEQCALGNVGAQTARVAEFVALKTGTVLDNRYVITHLIGRGGMGAVYKAVDKEIESECAIKVLAPELAASAEAVTSLRREVAIAQKLTHQNLLRVNYLCTNSSPPFLVMEHIDGEDLETYRLRKGGKLSSDDFCHVATQILAGLTYLHDKGVVHLDIKPQNVMVAKTGEVKLTDFGIARTIKEQLASKDQSQVPMGTLCYMAPEQLRGEVCDLHADVYSLGILFHLLLAGKFPFPTTAREDVVAWHLGPEYAPDGVPREWCRLLRKCLARKPQDRFSSCAEIVASLRHEESATHDGQAGDEAEADSVEAIVEPEIVLDELSGRELHADEEVALLFKPLYERTTLNKETVQKVRAHLTAWADSIPHHKFREFGKSLSIREALHLPYYSIHLQTQYENRTVKRVEVPYTGWNLPQLQVNEDNINVWSYSWPLIKDFETGEEEHPIDDSQKIIVCDTCDGGGQVTCPTCSGKGRLRCPNCHGTGQIQQFRSVQKWRTVTKYEGSNSYQVNEPYETTEVYYVQCVTCGATGAVTCHGCSGSGQVQCPVCRGTGKMVSLLVVTDSFGPQEDSHVHRNPQCTEEVAGLIEDASHYRPVVSLLGDAIKFESLGAMDNTGLQEAVNGVLASGQARCSGTQRILRQRLSIGMADVLHVGYDFQGAQYDLRVAGTEWTAHAPMSPFVKLIENSVGWAKERLETGKIADGLKMLERCFQMQQADQVVEGVFRAFRKRFADAYAQEAAKYGQWWAESLYFSDRAKQLEPGHPAATAHDKAVTARLGAIAFVPGACAGAIVAIAGMVSNRPDVAVVGAITPIVMSALLWFLYGKKALNTVFVISASLAAPAIAGMTFYTIGSTKYSTPEDTWLYSGIAGVILSVIMATAAACLPSSLRRERTKAPKNSRESLARAQAFQQKDWEEIKASYKTGPFPATGEAFSSADSVRAKSVATDRGKGISTRTLTVLLSILAVVLGAVFVSLYASSTARLQRQEAEQAAEKALGEVQQALDRKNIPEAIKALTTYASDQRAPKTSDNEARQLASEAALVASKDTALNTLVGMPDAEFSQFQQSHHHNDSRITHPAVGKLWDSILVQAIPEAKTKRQEAAARAAEESAAREMKERGIIGKLSIGGVFDKLDGEKVYLKKANGPVVVRFADLTLEDKQFVTAAALDQDVKKLEEARQSDLTSVQRNDANARALSLLSQKYDGRPLQVSLTIENVHTGGGYGSREGFSTEVSFESSLSVFPFESYQWSGYLSSTSNDMYFAMNSDEAAGIKRKDIAVFSGSLSFSQHETFRPNRQGDVLVDPKSGRVTSSEGKLPLRAIREVSDVDICLTLERLIRIEHTKKEKESEY